MQVVRDSESELLPQEDLTWRGIEKVSTSHDLVDALLGVIDDHSQLVAKYTVGSAQDKVTDLAIDTLTDCAEDTVGEFDQATVGALTPGRCIGLCEGHAFARMDAVELAQIVATAVARIDRRAGPESFER